jgi:hypothetical protein
MYVATGQLDAAAEVLASICFFPIAEKLGEINNLTLFDGATHENLVRELTLQKEAVGHEDDEIGM